MLDKVCSVGSIVHNFEEVTGAGFLTASDVCIVVLDIPLLMSSTRGTV